MPPTRDEESETQRKAHAKRVRETRRSTQGVTLDEIKSAEQLVKMKNANNNSTNGNVSEILRILIKFFLSENLENNWFDAQSLPNNLKIFRQKNQSHTPSCYTLKLDGE